MRISEIWAVTLIVASATACALTRVIPGDSVIPLYTALLGYAAKGLKE